MGKEFWIGESAGPKYRAPAYDIEGNRYLEHRAAEMGKRWGGRMSQEAARVSGLDPGGYWGDRQKAFGEALLGAAEGTAPSAAELTMRAGLEQATAQGSALSRSMPGLSPAMAMRLANQARTQNTMQTLQQAGILRADEMSRARDAYANFMGGARGQDMQSIQLMEGLRQQYLNMGMTAEQAALAARMEMERQRQQAWATQQQVTAASVTPGTGGFLGNAASAFAGGLGQSLSDRREKKNIKPASDEALKKFAEALEGYSFDYKKDAPTGEDSKKKKHWGVMAQDLEKKGGSVGKSVVNTWKEPGMPAQKAQPAQPGREVKTLDTQATLGAALAAIGNLHKRLKKLEA